MLASDAPIDEPALAHAITALLRGYLQSRQGYAEASESVGSSRAKRLLHRLELQRATFLAELEALAPAGTPEPATGAVPASGDWVVLYGEREGRKDAAVLRVCLKNERATLARLRQVAALRLPDAVRRVVERQRQGVEAGVAALQGLLEGDATPGRR